MKGAEWPGVLSPAQVAAELDLAWLILEATQPAVNVVIESVQEAE